MVAKTSPSAGTIDNVILEKLSCLAKVSIRARVVRASVPWLKRYPSRSAYIFLNGTMAGRGGISKFGAMPVVLPYAIKLLRWFRDWRVEIYLEVHC